MIEGIDTNQRIEFTSKYDMNDPKTVFILRPLSGFEMMEFSDGKMEDVKRMVLRSIVEIRNFNKECSIEDVLNSLNLKLLAELINKINNINQLSGEDEKN